MSSYEIILTTSANKSLKNIKKSDPKIYKRIVSAISTLSTNPEYGKGLKGELKGIQVIRVWPYRILYKVVKHEVVVYILKIAHRKEAYE